MKYVLYNTRGKFIFSYSKLNKKLFRFAIIYFARAQSFTAGDIVGVLEGLLSLNTLKVDRCMIVSMKPVILGSSPGPGVTGYALVGFIGQVYVNVVSPVNSGEYISIRAK